jgi:hypothetical protein
MARGVMCRLEARRVVDIDDEHVMTRFLVGTLATAEQELVEERLAADPAYFEAMCALEDELLLKWHRGELSHEERQLFAHAYQASPSRRIRAASERQLIDAIDEWKQNNEVRWFSWAAVRYWLATPRHVPQFTMAAAVVLVLAAVPLAVYEMSDAMRQLHVMEQENAALRHQIGSARHLSVVFPLSPASERGNETPPGTNVLRIPRDADEVRLQFEMADPGTAVGFDAIIETMERTIAATPRPVRFDRTAGAALVTLTVAAGELHDADYVLKLRRRTADGSSDTVATRTFRVIRE